MSCPILGVIVFAVDDVWLKLLVVLAVLDLNIRVSVALGLGLLQHVLEGYCFFNVVIIILLFFLRAVSVRSSAVHYVVVAVAPTLAGVSGAIRSSSPVHLSRRPISA
jgi:hypothetical protein